MVIALPPGRFVWYSESVGIWYFGVGREEEGII